MPFYERALRSSGPAFAGLKAHLFPHGKRDIAVQGMTDIAIIGGGAAGLACAARLASSGRRISITIIEPADRTGRKLSQTGNGQGNVSNTDLGPAHFHGATGLAADIVCSGRHDWASLFGCLWTTDDRGRIYPASRQASSLTDLLLRRISSSKTCTTDIMLGTKATKIRKAETGEGFCIETDQAGTGRGKVESRYAVLCTGGAVARQFHTDGSSYALATGLGHTLTPIHPSLVQLKTDMTDIKPLRGIRADASVLAIKQGKGPGKELASSRGDVIFTSYGVSGSAVFEISSGIIPQTDSGDVELRINFLPDFQKEEVAGLLQQRCNEGCAPENLLCGILHNTVSRTVVRKAREESLGGGRGAGNESLVQSIVRLATGFPLKVTGSAGADYAQVTKGGVPGDEVSAELESRLAPGLFLAGELVDVDGDCGGYNLQWAFCSGMEAADALLKRL